MADDSLVFAFRGRDLLVRADGASTTVPDAEAWAALSLPSVRENDLGAREGRRALAVELPEDAPAPPGTAFEGLRRLWSRLDEATYAAAGRAVQIVEWDRSHQFCAACATPLDRVPEETAKRCPRCRRTFYPRLSPAVIVLVTRRDEVLLARSASFPAAMYSTLAGFVEPGETLEGAVHREIREEVGVEVREVRYFGSQPWPFPDSLMIAFTAEHAGGDLRPDQREIADAGWFRADAMPAVPPRLSIARALIDAWMRGRGGDPDALRSPF